MELVLKISKGKPPFIGVLFRDKAQAVTMNLNYIPHNCDEEHDLVLEPSQKLLMTLFYKTGFSDKYEVGYDPVALLKFVYLTRNSTHFSFAHLVMKDGKMALAKTPMGGLTMRFKVKSLKLNQLVIDN